MAEIFGNTTTTPLNPNAFSGGGNSQNIVIDQTYNPESENAQSGKAVAEAIANIGGGGSPSTPSGTEPEWDLVQEITVDPETEAYSITTDINGNLFEYDEFMLDITGIKAVSTSTKEHLIIYLCKESRTTGNSVVIDLQMYDMIGTSGTSYYFKTSKFHKLDKYRIECRGSLVRDWNFYTIPYTQKFKAVRVKTGKCSAGTIKVYGRKVV